MMRDAGQPESGSFVIYLGHGQTPFYMLVC
jgi:hypothetical protein